MRYNIGEYNWLINELNLGETCYNDVAVEALQHLDSTIKQLDARCKELEDKLGMIDRYLEINELDCLDEIIGF